jgi:hypothetical protein
VPVELAPTVEAVLVLVEDAPPPPARAITAALATAAPSRAASRMGASRRLFTADLLGWDGISPCWEAALCGG